MLPTFSEHLWELNEVELASVYGTMPLCPVCGHTPKALMRLHHRWYPLRQGQAPFYAGLLYFRSLEEKEYYIQNVFNRDVVSQFTYAGFHLNCSAWCRLTGLFLLAPAVSAQVALAH